MLLKRGDENSNVKAWQAFLNTLKYKLTVDGDFGPGTEGATRSFQAANNLRADGLVGPGTIAIAREKGFAGFVDDEVQIRVPESDKLILVSAGHTNNPRDDRGAAGNGFIEGDEAVALRDHVAALLRQKGVSVLEDGADGVSEPLRKALVLARKADIAIEFHWNAGPPAATGIEVLSKPAKKHLAQRLANAIHQGTGIQLRGDKGWKADNSGQHHRLAFCEAGGLIIEICFISNPSDMRRYKDGFTAVCNNIAEVLAEA